MVSTIFIGLGLKDFLNNEEICFDQAELLGWYTFYSFDVYFQNEIDFDRIYNSTYSATLAFATISPVLRKCYNFSEENEDQWVRLAQRLFNAENLFISLR